MAKKLTLSQRVSRLECAIVGLKNKFDEIDPKAGVREIGFLQLRELEDPDPEERYNEDNDIPETKKKHVRGFKNGRE